VSLATPAAHRRPWYWLAALVAVAIAATALLVLNARARIAQNDRQFEAGLLARLDAIEVRIDDYFAVAKQLAAAGTETLAPVHGDTIATERIVTELFLARRNPDIYGLGVFYAPGTFFPGVRLFSIYDETGPTGATLQFLQKPGDVDYQRYEWWRDAVDARGATAFGGPYSEDGKSFISTMEAFDHDGRLAGVITVDTLTGTFKRMMSARLSPGDVAWILGRDRRTWVVGTAPLPQAAGDRIDRQLKLRYTSSYLFLSSDATALHATERGIVSATAALCVAAWLFAVLLAAILVQSWSSRATTLALERERERLENEITVSKKIESELRKAAYTDELTGLPNRYAFLERAAATIANASAANPFAVLMIDLDRFNIVNETLGHPAGDELLKSIANRLPSALPPESWLGRLGGDEFLALVAMDAADAMRCAQAILTALREPVLLGGRVIFTTASIGIVLVDAEHQHPEELLRDVDIAMYEAKQRGRAGAALFDAAMRKRVADESDLERDLRQAIDRRELVPYYQPIVDTVRCAPASFEALVRWPRDTGVVEAGDFVGYAERHGLVDAIDTLVLEKVCADTATIFGRFPDATIAVNVSAAHLTAPDLAATIEQALRAHAISPERIKLEITETAIMSNATRARDTLDRLREFGMQIILDDFGAGHSSLAYLHRLPIAGLKIDRSFIEHLPSDAQALAIVRSIVALAQTLGLYTVAEGVENAGQLAVVRQLGVTYAQGFLFAPGRDLAGLLHWEALRTG
jgi:diguanylate cyclase (GGDEF)-like protein